MLEKYKNDFVVVAREVDRVLYEISRRSESLETTSLEEVETKEQKELKKKLSYNSTYSIFDLVKGHLTKFQSNKVLREFDIKSEEEKKAFIQHLIDIDYLQSVDIIIDKAFNAPNDFILIEKDTENEGKPIIIFIPINSVFYYDDITLIYELDISTDEEKVFRLIQWVDYQGKTGWWDFVIRKKPEEKAKISQKAGEKPQIYGFNEEVILQKKPFRQVGGLVFKDQVKDSLLFTTIEKFKIYKRDSDIFEESKVLHAFPEKITLAFKCLKCSGTGIIDDGANGSYKCDACNGTGEYWVKNTAEVLKVPQTIPNDMKPYMPEIVKYVEKDIKTLEFQRENLKQLEQEIEFHATGLKNIAVNSLKTATEVQENQIPLNTRINKIINYIESVEVWALTVLGKLFTNKFGSVIVKYQRFYTGRTEEDILTEIKRGKEIGLNMSFLRSLYLDWIRAYYRNEPQKLEEQLKLADVEPYPFFTLKELKEHEVLLNPSQLKIKLELQNFVNRLDLTKEPKEIKAELLTKIKENESTD